MMIKMQNRLQKLRQKLPERELDGILISQPENRRYLSGFDGSAGYLLITQKNAVLATDFRYVEQAKAQAPDYEIFQTEGSLVEWFPRLVGDCSARTLGLEAGHVTVSEYQMLSDGLERANSQTSLVPVEGLVEPIRAIKEPEEIELITRAVEISDKAMDYMREIIREGMTEKEIAWELERFMREQGSQAMPFEIIVASGPNAALPHAKPSERKIRTQEPIVIDMGARFGGYCSDITRTFILDVSPYKEDKLNKVYDTVLGAQLAAIAILKEGITGEEADNLPRMMIMDAGYDKAFGHSLGHGIGLAAHEQPRLGPRSNDILKSGMVFSIEPGIYLPGWGGVRIEDLVVLEDGKAKVLSKAKK
jgi:Xaa-Pro aminopeptidase